MIHKKISPHAMTTDSLGGIRATTLAPYRIYADIRSENKRQ